MGRYLNLSAVSKRNFFATKIFYNWITLSLLVSLPFLTACNNGGGGSGTVGYTLSGSIRMPGHTAVDSDVNDAWESAPAPETNDSFADAQLLSSPVILGGYVTEAGSEQCASGGRLCKEGDPSDFYKVALSDDQTISLYVADSLEAAVYLYDADEILLDSVTGSSNILSLSITDADGEYYVEVRAESGASNYTLTISAATLLTQNQLSHADNDFVPGEFIVRFTESGNSQKFVSSANVKAQTLGLSVASMNTNGPLLVRIPDDNTETLFKNLKMQSVVHNTLGINGAGDRRNAKLVTLQVIEAMRRRQDVLYAEPNYIRKPLAVTPNDEYYDLQWHYPLIRLPDAWGLIPEVTEPVVVAVVDTGVLLAHPDLADQLTTDGYDFISDTASANDGDGRDDNPNDSGDLLYNDRSSFHGTHVSGTIAAATDNDVGGAGVAWGTQTRIMALRALGIDGGSSYDIMEAVKYAAGLPNESGRLPDQRADVINLSIGGSASSDAEREVFEQVRAQGVIVVAAAGNEATSTPVYPAAYDSVISVNAVGPTCELAPYSNYGATIDIAAPGGDFSSYMPNTAYPYGVLSTLGDDSGSNVLYQYGFSEGTSMATPHVAGVIALMKAVAPELTPDEFDAYLISGALTSDIGPIGNDTRFGYGLIDAYSAVLSAQGVEIPTVLKVTPPELIFGSEVSTLTLNAQIMGSGSLSITAVTTDESWVSITPLTDDLDLDADSSTADIPSAVAFDVSIERSEAVLDGTYGATITFNTTENTVNVPVSMQITSTDQTSDAGFHYIVLMDSDSGEVKDIVTAVAQNGSYDFQFDDVTAGQYYLLAGSDMDNDGEIGESGEAFGMFLSTEQPVVIDVSSDLTGLNFLSGFSFRLPLGSRTNLPGPMARQIRDGGFKIEK